MVMKEAPKDVKKVVKKVKKVEKPVVDQPGYGIEIKEA